ncbi:fungal-specific transcription factor domain-containing protein [Phyllosticta capitalensis]
MALENRVAWFENFVGRLKRASSTERDAILDEISLDDHLRAGTRPQSTPREFGSFVYEIDDLPAPSDMSSVAQHFGIQDSWIEQGLQSFFKWQYPNCMFIYREAFIRDHYQCGEYWSPSLLYSICALGSDGDVSERFFAAAESILMVSGLEKPCLTTVQAFLCMAFFEIGRGNLSKGWNFSGMAFRMSQDLGLQRDPYWISNPEDVQIRRRIYWGAYLADKLISLFLGKPVSLHEDDGMVEGVDRLPDLPEMAPWLPAGLEFESALPSFQSLVELAKIIQRMLTKYAVGADVLDSLNLDLHRWQESLPDSLKWNKWATTNLYPHVAVLHLILNSVRLRLNLDVAVSSPSSRVMCLSSIGNIIALIRKYRAQHGLKKASLIFVYGIVQAATGITMLEPCTTQLSFLIQSLDECSLGLATQAKKRVEIMRGSA